MFGIATAKSEKRDKQTWHLQIRSRVRTALSSSSPKQLDEYITAVSNEVCNVWAMSKDGKRYFHPDKQDAVATRVAARGKTSIERQSLKIRLL